MADQRLTWLTRRPTPWSAVVPLVALGAGLLFAVSAATAKGTDLRASSTDLPGLIRQETLANARAQQSVSSLRSEVNRLSAEQAPGNQQVTQLTSRADSLTLAAGVDPVQCPTVKVTLNDAKNVPSVLPRDLTV